ncbi:MAG: DNA-3-methyladenine glycosylase 2 family protein [Bacteroidota bacterium]
MPQPLASLSPSLVDQLVHLDPLFGTILEAHGPAPDWRRPAGFTSLLHIILEQQVSLESAQAAFDRLQARLGTISPPALLSLSDEELRACAFSRQKTRYARELARALISGQLELEKLGDGEEAQVRAQLCAIKGIGQWTADVYLIFCLDYPDIFPVGDIAAINSVKELTGLVDKEAVVRRSQNWRPLRTAATKMLWHSYLCRRGRTYGQ